MSLSGRTEILLTKKHGQFLLAWSVSFLAAQPLLAYYFSRMPSSGYTPWWVPVGSIVSGEALVAVIAATVIFLLAQPLEKRFASRNTGPLAAAFSYLGILAALGIFVMAAMTPLIAVLRLEGAAIYWPATIGFAALVSAPVAFVARWVYPSVASRVKLATVVIWVGAGSGSLVLLGSILFQVAFRLIY